jgi:hypothetical protein
MDLNSWCVPSAIHDAWVAKGNKYKVRIIVQKIDAKENIDHVQAEAFINDEWTPLTSHRHAPDGRKIVETWQRHYPDNEVYRFVDLTTFISEQLSIMEDIGNGK